MLRKPNGFASALFGSPYRVRIAQCLDVEPFRNLLRHIRVERRIIREYRLATSRKASSRVHLFIQLFPSLFTSFPSTMPRPILSLLSQSGLNGLEDLNLDTGLSLILLGSVGSDDSLSVSKTSSDGLL